MSDLLGLPSPDLTTTTTTTATVPTAVNGYIALPITVDPQQLMADAFGFIQEQIPGWQPAEGHLETWLIEAVARIVSVYAIVAAQMPLEAFMYLGGQLLGLPPETGAAAEVPTTWTMVDSQGYTVPAGTVVGFATSGNTTVQFETTAPFTVPAGSTATSAGAVTLSAVTTGSAANGIAAGPMALVSSLAYVSSVVSTQATSGGADAETTSAYLDRLSNLFTILTPRPVLAADFAKLAASQAGVARALGIDNFDPYNNLLTANDASPTSSAGTWTAVTNCSVAHNSTYGLAVTSTASGAVLCETGWYPVSAGQTYTGIGSFRAASHAESTCVLGLQWGDINQNALTPTTGTAVTDTTTGTTAASVSGTAPSTACYVRLTAAFTAAAASEVQYLSSLGINLGTSTTWGAGGAQSGQERCVTVVPVDAYGDALTSTEMSAISTYLAGMREVNFLVNVVPPNYVAIDVSAAVVAQSNADLDAVQAAVAAAIQSYLSPANWAGGSQTPAVWLADTTVYIMSVAAVINAVSGVHHIVAGSLTLNGGTSDVSMPGYAPLPSASVTVTVTAASSGT